MEIGFYMTAPFEEKPTKELLEQFRENLMCEYTWYKLKSIVPELHKRLGGNPRWEDIRLEYFSYTGPCSYKNRDLLKWIIDETKELEKEVDY